MFPDSAVDPGLVHAYRETHYRVNGPRPFTLRVDESSADLIDAYAQFGAHCSAFVSACNPFGQAIGDARNAHRHADLAKALTRRGLPHLAGIGQHPTNLWPGEPSYLVFGLDLEAATILGRQLEQNAILWSGADAVPRLLLLR